MKGILPYLAVVGVCAWGMFMGAMFVIFGAM